VSIKHFIFQQEIELVAGETGNRGCKSQSVRFYSWDMLMHNGNGPGHLILQRIS